MNALATHEPVSMVEFNMGFMTDLGIGSTIKRNSGSMIELSIEEIDAISGALTFIMSNGGNWNNTWTQTVSGGISGAIGGLVGGLGGAAAGAFGGAFGGFIGSFTYSIYW